MLGNLFGCAENLKRYRRFREVSRRLISEIMSRIATPHLRDCARRLGMQHDQTLVFDNESELSILMDYAYSN